jgi:hypothetical protein
MIDSIQDYSKVMPYLRQLVTGFPLRQPGFEARSGHVEFVVDNMAVGQVLSLSILVSPANFHSTNCSTFFIIYHPGLVR